jgi:hypothetical protein
MPIYTYQHPVTKKIYEDLRSVSDRDKPLVLDDGTKCERILFAKSDKPANARTSRAGEKLEPFQADPDFVKKMNPKYIKFRDGHRERYDPNKHC